jgi:tetratricopeptide (TPR) repeat protein
MQGRWREAVAANQEIIASFTNDVEAHNRLGKAYMELGEYSLAREAYSRAAELDHYNVIAKKNLWRLSHLQEDTVGSEVDASKVEPQQFIEETGKAGVVHLGHLAPQEILARVVAGDKAYLKLDGSRLIVEDGLGTYLGEVEPRHGRRLIKLMEGGNRYEAAVISSTEDSITVIIREVYEHPSQVGQLSFPARGLEEIRPYAGDRMLRRESENEDLLPDELAERSNRAVEEE